jgi:hypothetical protein
MDGYIPLLSKITASNFLSIRYTKYYCHRYCFSKYVQQKESHLEIRKKVADIITCCHSYIIGAKTMAFSITISQVPDLQ